MFAAVVLGASAVFATVTGRALDLVGVNAEDKVVWLDVLAFLLIAVVYLIVMSSIGFWLSSFLMLSSVSLYLTRNKTRHNVTLAIVVPLASCVVAYVVFIKIFYVPVPQGTWWGIFG